MEEVVDVPVTSVQISWRCLVTSRVPGHLFCLDTESIATKLARCAAPNQHNDNGMMKGQP